MCWLMCYIASDAGIPVRISDVNWKYRDITARFVATCDIKWFIGQYTLIRIEKAVIRGFCSTADLDQKECEECKSNVRRMAR